MQNARSRSHALHAMPHLDAVVANYSTKDHMLTVQVWCVSCAEEKLRAVCVWPRVCHAQGAQTTVTDCKVLVGKLRLDLGIVNRAPATAVAAGDVAALAHEARNDAMERAAAVGQRPAVLGRSIQVFACAELPEILRGPWGYVAEQANHDAVDGAGAPTADPDVEEDRVRDGRLVRVHHRCGLVVRPALVQPNSREDEAHGAHRALRCRGGRAGARREGAAAVAAGDSRDAARSRGTRASQHLARAVAEHWCLWPGRAQQAAGSRLAGCRPQGGARQITVPPQNLKRHNAI